MSSAMPGAAYLVWIAFNTLRGGRGVAAPDGQAAVAFAAWRDGTLVNMLNPKIIVFMFAFLPPFIRPENGSAAAATADFRHAVQYRRYTDQFCRRRFSPAAPSRFFLVTSRSHMGLRVVSAALFLVLAARMVFDSR